MLSIYLDDHVATPEVVAKRTATGSIARLNEFFGGMKLAEVTEQSCAAYVAWRIKVGKTRNGSEPGGGARRDLQTLKAAINLHAKKGYHLAVVAVSMPAAGLARQLWLERDELAKLLWVCHRTREIQEGVETKKRPLAHLVRVLLLGVYTGSRPGAIFNAAWIDQLRPSHVDLERGVFHRHASGRAETNKRQPTVRMPTRLVSHLRRSRAADAGKNQPYVVQFDGMPVKNVKTALTRACELAGIRRITVYTLRHTCAAWLVSKGVSTRMVAEYLGASEQMIIKHYTHLSPDYQKHVTDALGRR
ncbi:tyrosine-type recombinase/integrase [Methylocystis echinoides]|uniref:Integrase n=1 Tax=Methylocystis echinoides TaxID=29468 RepID=A0A9W6GSY8_9HYPH|nr:site-specific integrase [Methylocystis echinoides]GLI92359.1 integrase [Methylocystis echinoides]